MFGAASEAFSQRNINCSHRREHRAFRARWWRRRATRASTCAAPSRCAVGCPYEGEVAPERVSCVARLMKDIGVQHVRRGRHHRRGHAASRCSAAMERRCKHYALDDVSGHFHDTYGQALANTLACLEMGVWQFDTSVAGLGGCPYAKGATGNVATEDVVYMLHGMGIETGIDLDKLVDAGEFISDFLERPTELARGQGAVQQAASLMCGAELKPLPEGVQRVARALQDKGHPHAPVMLDDAARTAQQAADALGIARGPDCQEHHLPAQARRRGGAGDHLGRPARGREARWRRCCVDGKSSAAPMRSSSRRAPAFPLAACRRWRMRSRR